ncbi:hypothetical protein NA57DRAFT_42152 [Rhizodiscina lignyota]|uniref:Xylanolytic transcriptional activator regulatory domain-containing protein n=1 Tax=Rhizodiscina lignyota TaxID=1504668 RepID=A0A9P4I7S9_9PEZI|nr:hypothetical protein NA57DRAFT_42152 [Rhizodiscina lignyota]
MAGEAGARPLLPQTAQLQSYGFVQHPQPREQQRNYVFVDEHNRHKRLKACTRLKLTCVPPTVSYEKDMSGSQTFEVNPPQQYRTVDHVQMYQPSMPPSMPPAAPPGPLPQPGHMSASYSSAFPTYQPPSYVDLSSSQASLPSYNSAAPAAIPNQNYTYPPHQAFDASYQHPAGDLAWNGELGTDSLTEALGQLNIDHTGNLASTQAVEDYEADLPVPQHTSSDYRVRIPQEMFPSEQRALQYFKYFFDNIHPYCPVINRAAFYQQWHTNKDSISALLLEGIFACSSLALEGAQAGTKWLALASKHEDSFKDVARLSTIQAMIILLKAREAVPKRGYYYRSWMTVVSSVLMSQELELHEHLELHRNGIPCGATPSECAEKTRIWHMLFILEIMVGGPQGRRDFRVEADTIDFNEPTNIPGFDEAEFQISRQFTYLIRIAKNIKETNLMWQTLRKRRKDWGLDPAFVAHNQVYVNWIRDLPRDMQIQMPADGSLPWMPSHYIGQLHCYYYLSVIMHHRPQIHFLSDAGDPGWKSHMMLCYNSAKAMCRLQEAIIQKYGLDALSCMQRGISFTIYCVLTCTMLHLAAITAPDPELNSEAPDYFVRHMQILEQCVPHWDMPEMHAQINALREAFSADTSKPFALKPSFPHGSPPAHRASQSPPFPADASAPYGSHAAVSGAAHDVPLDSAPGQVPPASVSYPSSHPITPPISTTDSEPKTDSPVGQQSLVSMGATTAGATGQLIGATGPRVPTSVAPQEQAQWNPTRIFEYVSIAEAK